MNYQERINKVLNHIDFNLGKKLDLDSLAEMAYFSKFHFHRVMKAYLGESLASYINRLRIETGARLLKYSDNSISEIAHKIGFETPTSFHKSFKKVYNTSPSNFKKNNSGTFSIATNKKQPKEFKLTIEIKRIKPFNVLCNQIKGKVGDKKTFDGWADLLSFAINNGLISDKTKFIAIQWDDPTITLEENIRYDACISLTDDFKSESKYFKKIFSGGKYLCVLYQGDYINLIDVYSQIFKDIIFKNNYQIRDEPIFEEFLNNINKTPKHKLITCIHIPIE